MRCIFCKADSAASRSVEHIIPEALGNKEHTLPRGMVCDTCNNYFARKVEAPLLETGAIKHARSRQWIANKRGRVPPLDGLVPGARLAADVWTDGRNLTLCGRSEWEDQRLVEAIRDGHARSVYIPVITAIDERLMARFMAKIALEIFAQHVRNVEGWEHVVIDDPQLEALRRFARVGDIPLAWPISRRRIYGENDVQVGGYQILHEYMLFYTDRHELYVVLCLFGEEFAINCGGPEISGYQTWLSENHYRSPLYLSDILPSATPSFMA